MQKGIGVLFFSFFFSYCFFIQLVQNLFLSSFRKKHLYRRREKKEKNMITNASNEMGLIEKESLSHEKEPIVLLQKGYISDINLYYYNDCSLS